MNVDCVCVVYNPDKVRLFQCISSVCSQVNKVWIIDNSDYKVDFSDILTINENINIYSLGENKGIAFALNYGCKLALQNEADWLLTLDQDSIIPKNMISSYLDVIEEQQELKIGIICCNIRCCRNDSSNSKYNEILDQKLCWTSGSLMNLACYKMTNGFNDDLFIDGVDFDYCYSIRNIGYKIIKNCKVVMDHKLGESEDYKLFGCHLFYVTNHNHIRWYYIVRNSLWISYKYSDVFPEAKFSYYNICKYLGKIIMFEKNKVDKIKAVYRGYKDFKYRRFGKYTK